VNTSKIGFFRALGGIQSSTSIRFRVVELPGDQEAILTPLILDMDVVNAANYSAGPTFYHFAYKADNLSDPVESFVQMDGTGAPVVFYGLAADAWDQIMNPFLQAYWTAWMGSMFKDPAEAVRVLSKSQGRQLFNAGDYGASQIGEHYGEAMTDSAWGGAAGGAAVNAVLNRHEWAENPADEAEKTVGGVVGSVAGAAVGEYAGGAAGGALGGAVGGPVGAAVGEEVGSFVGKKVGGYVGEQVGEHLAPDAAHAVSDVWHHF